MTPVVKWFATTGVEDDDSVVNIHFANGSGAFTESQDEAMCAYTLHSAVSRLIEWAATAAREGKPIVYWHLVPYEISTTYKYRRMETLHN